MRKKSPSQTIVQDELYVRGTTRITDLQSLSPVIAQAGGAPTDECCYSI